MSQAEPATIDPASHHAPVGRFDPHGTLLDVTTDVVPERERLSFWREQVLRRLEPTKALVEDQPFRAHVRRIIGPGAELLDCTSDAVHVVRTAARCRRDGCDDISIDLYSIGREPASSMAANDGSLTTRSRSKLPCVRVTAPWESFCHAA
jgi:hypothetical protein